MLCFPCVLPGEDRDMPRGAGAGRTVHLHIPHTRCPLPCAECFFGREMQQKDVLSAPLCFRQEAVQHWLFLALCFPPVRPKQSQWYLGSFSAGVCPSLYFLHVEMGPWGLQVMSTAVPDLCRNERGTVGAICHARTLIQPAERQEPH